MAHSAFGRMAVEYRWVGIGLALTARYFAHRGTVRSLLLFAGMLLLLVLMSRSPAPLAVLIVIAALRSAPVSLPRWQGAFHCFYARHLWIPRGFNALLA